MGKELEDIREGIATGISVNICVKCGGVGEVCDRCRLPDGYDYEVADQLLSYLAEKGVAIQTSRGMMLLSDLLKGEDIC